MALVRATAEPAFAFRGENVVEPRPANAWASSALGIRPCSDDQSEHAADPSRPLDCSGCAAYRAAPMWDREQADGRLRISDADRDQISNVLGEHAAEGRLTLDELDRRLGVLYTAQTRAEVAPLVALAAPLRPPMRGKRASGRGRVVRSVGVSRACRDTLAIRRSLRLASLLRAGLA